MNKKVCLQDTDPRRFTDPTWADNCGSFSIVCGTINSGLVEIGCFSEPDSAEYVGISDGLNLLYRYGKTKAFIINVFDCINILPIELVEAQKKTGIIVVGLSRQVSELWQKFGVNSKYIQIGTDTGFYQPVGAKNEKFSFLFDSYSNVRSGLELAIQAYHLAFNGKNYADDVQLIIKNISDSKQLELKIFEYRGKGNNIKYINQRTSFDEMRTLYSQCQVLLAIMHHSSWGLSIHQAAACDCLPVVGNFCPSNDMAVDVLLNPTSEVYIEDKLPELVNEWGLHNAYPMDSKYFTYDEKMRYYDYSVQDYAELLRDIYENWQNKYSKIDTRTRIVKEWTNKRAAEQLVNILKEN